MKAAPYEMLRRYDELIAQRDVKPSNIIVPPHVRETVSRTAESLATRAPEPAQLDLFGGKR